MASILSRLKGRKVEIQEYMKKIANPEMIEGKLNEVFERLKSIPLNQKLLQLADGINESLIDSTEEENKDFELTNYTPQYDMLFSFVNSEQVDELKNSALKHYEDLKVFLTHHLLRPKLWKPSKR